MTNEEDIIESSSGPDAAGQIVGRFVPHKNGLSPKDVIRGGKATPVESESFRRAFIDTLRGKGEGLLTRYLFHEANFAATDRKKETPDQDIYAMLNRHFGRILYGGLAWDQMIEHTNSYDFVDGDLRALDYAVKMGLVSQLPSNVHIIEYGTGGKSGAEKPIHTIEAILKSERHEVSGYAAIDILSRYAIESAQAVHDRFNMHATAIACDFMTADKIVIPAVRESTPLSLIFGGTLANAPDYSASGGKSGPQNAIVYLTKMNGQHDIGPYLLMGYDAETNPAMLTSKYQATDEFSAFALGSFTRAIQEGIITDSSYDPFRYWKMEARYDAAAKAVKLCAVCTENHVMPTIEGDFSFQTGKSLTNILSYKWDEMDYREMLSQADFELVSTYRQKGSPYGIILARPKSGQQSLNFNS